MRVSTSIGIAIYPGDGGNQHDLLTNADAAMYHAKGLGRNAYSFFEPSMNADVHQQLQLVQDLRRDKDRIFDIPDAGDRADIKRSAAHEGGVHFHLAIIPARRTFSRVEGRVVFQRENRLDDGVERAPSALQDFRANLQSSCNAAAVLLFLRCRHFFGPAVGDD